jgi:RNA polymerase sigma factor (TIGR02999 family)
MSGSPVNRVPRPHPASEGVDDRVDDRTRAVYARLREIARGCLRGERRDHTLQATALANEVYLKLGDLEDLPPDQLGPIVATTCRRVLIDHARARGRTKRGGGRIRLRLDPDHVATGGVDPIEPLILDEALERLRQLHERQARVFELRYFGGMTPKSVAALLEVSLRTVEGDHALARAWLMRELGSGDAAGSAADAAADADAGKAGSE